MEQWNPKKPKLVEHISGFHQKAPGSGHRAPHFHQENSKFVAGFWAVFFVY